MKILVYSIIFFFIFSPVVANCAEIRLINKGGIYELPVKVNGVITLNFILDSGASEVNIPADVALTLIRTGTINENDFLPGKKYTLADGSTVKSPRFLIRELDLGGQKTFNVPASVGEATGHLLLGQSFLSRITSWTIDNQKHAFIFSALQPGVSSPDTESKTSQTFTDKNQVETVERETDVKHTGVQPAGTSSQTELSANDIESIKQTTRRYYELVQKKNIDGAMECYSSEKRPQIRRSRLEAVARDTEYYKIEKISVIPMGGNRAKAITTLLHKKYNQKPESWEITIEYLREQSSWKILNTPGKKISP